jgi:TetR/AcrR family transcriptional regulator
MSYIAERRQEEKDRRRNEILDAAEDVFANVGLEKATMDQVARKARLSRALLYVYFEDKADLLMGVCERALIMLRARFLQAAAAHERGIDKIEAIGRAYVTFAQECPVHFESLVRFEMLEPDPELYNQPHGLVFASDAVHDFLVEVLTIGIEDGSIRKDLGDRDLTAITLWGFMHGIIQLIATKANLLAHDGVKPEQLVEHALRMAHSSLANPKS